MTVNSCRLFYYTIMKYFTFEEMTKSNTANRLHIDNTPNDVEVIENINNTLEQLESIREVYGEPIIITSGYRCEELNRAVGGVKNSHHLRGYAADIIVKGDMMKLYNLIKDNFKYTQLIWEGTWIHYSYIPSNLKCQSFSV